jgi:hypothetical protein
VVVFTLGEDLTEMGGVRKIILIFPSVVLPAVFIAAQRHWVRKFWRGRKTASFGGYVFLSTMNKVPGIISRKF